MFIASRPGFSVGHSLYVESLHRSGDPYGYTPNPQRALLLTERQARIFVAYVGRCGGKSQLAPTA